MFLKLYRRKIAEQVDEKMRYMGTCPNERDMILSIIAPKSYNNKEVPHCGTDCWNTNCRCWYRKESCNSQYWILYKNGFYFSGYDEEGGLTLTRSRDEAYKFFSFDQAMDFFNKGYCVMKGE